MPTPGHDCPGLIEAIATDRSSSKTRKPLRGMIAPASLKPHDGSFFNVRFHAPLRGMIAPASLKLIQRDLCLDRVIPTPGHDCPGLIEADDSGCLSGPARKPLRGMIAPASLKRLDRRVQIGRERSPTPGHDCPGLIEAARSRRA